MTADQIDRLRKALDKIDAERDEAARRRGRDKRWRATPTPPDSVKALST